jgi:peptide/nickel transport system ATP-binding protein
MELGLTAPEAWWDCYPHQFSGTMRQLMAAALTLCAAPSLVIADEPTMAMEAAAHTQIIELLRRLSRDQGLSVILVTPDALEVAAIADRVVVLHGGRIVGADQVAGHAAPEPAISSPHGRTPAPHLAKHRHGG